MGKRIGVWFNSGAVDGKRKFDAISIKVNFSFFELMLLKVRKTSL
jgi:hypothetical protein